MSDPTNNMRAAPRGNRLSSLALSLVRSELDEVAKVYTENLDLAGLDPANEVFGTMEGACEDILGGRLLDAFEILSSSVLLAKRPLPTGARESAKKERARLLMVAEVARVLVLDALKIEEASNV